MANKKPRDRSPGSWTHWVIYLVMMAIVYHRYTPETRGNFTENQERDFHIAVARLHTDAQESKYAGYTLHQFKTGKIDLKSVSFLLTEDAFTIPTGDIHSVTVLERHPDWQLVEYHYGIHTVPYPGIVPTRTASSPSPTG